MVQQKGGGKSRLAHRTARSIEAALTMLRATIVISSMDATTSGRRGRRLGCGSGHMAPLGQAWPLPPSATDFYGRSKLQRAGDHLFRSELQGLHAAVCYDVRPCGGQEVQLSATELTQ